MNTSLRVVVLAAVIATAVSLVENVLASPATHTVSQPASNWHWTAFGNSIAINRTGITIRGTGGSIQITPAGIEMNGTMIQINCGGGGQCEPVARVGDPVENGTIVNGAPTVLAG